MDPNANLDMILRKAQKIIGDWENEDGNGVDQDEAADLAQAIEALDGWITNGGFLPNRWSR